MSELDDFLTPTLDRQVKAEQALVNGAAGLPLAMTSTQDPVTVFGAKVPLQERMGRGQRDPSLVGGEVVGFDRLPLRSRGR